MSRTPQTQAADLLDLDYELEQYVRTALWSSTDNTDDYGGAPLDENYGPDDIAPESMASMRADLAAFIECADPLALEFWEAELGAGQVGHDFWLTRNGHGAGFWDRFMVGVGATFGRHLTELAKPYGSSDIYPGDDGRLYS